VISASELSRVLPALPLIRVDAVYWRTVPNGYLQGPPPGAPAGSPPQPLWPGGAAMRGARYTRIGGSNALYLAPDGATALAEVEAVVFDPAQGLRPGPAHNPLLVFANQVRLPAVLDLCERGMQTALGTSEAELTAPWLRAQERHRAGRGPLPATQELGEAASATGAILALRYPSYRRKGARNLVVFTDHLAALGGQVVMIDRSGAHRQSLP
jgi:RES domain-containing protein